jgi:hypothetical protein
MVTTVAEMTPEDLKTLILETVQVALAETMGGPGWLAESRELGWPINAIWLRSTPSLPIKS